MNRACASVGPLERSVGLLERTTPGVGGSRRMAGLDGGGVHRSGECHLEARRQGRDRADRLGRDGGARGLGAGQEDGAGRARERLTGPGEGAGLDGDGVQDARGPAIRRARS